MAADLTLADRIIEWLAKYPPDDDDRIIKLNFKIGDLRAAAVRLRKLDAIEDAARSAVREIRASHYQDPLVRTLCVVCGAADGSYPCSALVEADALADALGGTE